MAYKHLDPDTPGTTVLEALGQSEEFLNFQEKISRVAPINRPVLILGERGTGKELAAARIHFLSKRWQHPLIAMNCSALNAALIETELFGHEKGAFTGAERERSGRFEAANQGTLFLDEIGTIPMEVQEKILRVVEYGTFERVGSWKSIEVDTRIIAATNADLPDMVEKGLFKRDLLDRLSFEVLFVPPLRNRREDILLLANHFASRMAFELEMETDIGFSADAVNTLTNYDWPGNIRELKNVVERAVYRSDADIIENIELDPFRSPFQPPPRPRSIPLDESQNGKSDEEKRQDHSLESYCQKPFNEAVLEFKARLLKNALEHSKFNQKKAAEKMGLTYHQFRGLYRKFMV